MSRHANRCVQITQRDDELAPGAFDQIVAKAVATGDVYEDLIVTARKLVKRIDACPEMRVGSENAQAHNRTIAADSVPCVG